MTTKILITGGNGFIGHHFCEHVLKTTDWQIYIMDRLSYAAYGYDRLRDIGCYDDKRVRHFTHDFTMPISEGLLHELSGVTYIVHMGAESHVDKSIATPDVFVKANVLGTMNILEFARECPKLKRMIYFSTDEIFGPASREEVPDGYSEWDRYNSTNPYSASKAGGEELCLAWANTYNVPVTITHTMNVFGERQHPEKFIPKIMRQVLDGQTVTIHADPTRKIPGSRYWIHARNVAAATMFLLDRGEVRDKYNIVGECEVDNLEMAQIVARILGKDMKYEMVDFHSSRPGHDLRYALNGKKLHDMGWIHPKTFIESLEKTIRWTLESPKWLEYKN